ncbi:HAD-IA family hydrolase [Streptomyces iakyrus]|uniref:HAD-IA family hydrolase n=1 Tax=Streptomyces iakyrus TaxID=68219 RepID=UPI000998420A|nr:HAD-IA family hydrolase [Streptomyces iakyrus]
MAAIRDIEVVVFDVLGTMVDEPGGLRSAVREATGPSGPTATDELVALWRRHCEREQERVQQGQRPYASTEVLDAEAARLVARHAGVTDPGAVARLATAGRRLPAWGDSVAGLERLSRRYPVMGLSNAGRTALLHLNAHAGLRWHRALSAEAVAAYKPAPEVYRLALDSAGPSRCPLGFLLHRPLPPGEGWSYVVSTGLTSRQSGGRSDNYVAGQGDRAMDLRPSGPLERGCPTPPP